MTNSIKLKKINICNFLGFILKYISRVATNINLNNFEYKNLVSLL